jgi:hypothetical protein
MALVAQQEREAISRGTQNLAIGLIFTVVSLARSYALRRAFDAILVRTPAATLGRPVEAHAVAMAVPNSLA